LIATLKDHHTVVPVL